MLSQCHSQFKVLYEFPGSGGRQLSGYSKLKTNLLQVITPSICYRTYRASSIRIKLASTNSETVQEWLPQSLPISTYLLSLARSKHEKKADEDASWARFFPIKYIFTSIKNELINNFIAKLPPGTKNPQLPNDTFDPATSGWYLLQFKKSASIWVACTDVGKTIGCS